MQSKIAWLTCAALLTACEGSLLGPLPAPSEDNGVVPTSPGEVGGEGKGNTGTKGSSSDGCGPRVPERLVLLSDFQHVSALRSLLGDAALAGDDLPNRQLKPFAQKGLVVNISLVHTRGEWAAEAAAKLSTNAATSAGCTTLDAACAEAYLRGFLSRAFRRPVDEAELTDLMLVYAEGAKVDAQHGLKLAVEAVLAAPSFTYRRELGISASDGTKQLDDYELASALSFALSDAPPDEALWKAAVAGELHEPAQVEAQLTRLLAQPAVQESLTSTLMASWGIGNVFGAAKDPGLFPSFTPQLQASMFHETELLVNDVLWTRKASINELLSTSTSFVDGALATLYGLPKPGGDANQFVKVTLPEDERAGLLTQPSVLSMLARSDTTSVVARGLFVRGLLCMPKTPSPPESLTTAISDLLKQDLTERERADVRAANPTCAGCHVGIDPFGLLLEDYDALGRHRTMLAGKPIDTQVTVEGTASYAGTHEDALSLVRSVAEDDDFVTCVAARTLSYALQDDALTPRDCQVKEALLGAPVGELGMSALVQKMFSSPALRGRSKETP